MSAPQLGQTSGSDSNNRASSMAQSESAEGRGRCVVAAGAETASAGGFSASALRPEVVTAARKGELGARKP